jgi:Na+/H+-dicarboxylate symporter
MAKKENKKRLALHWQILIGMMAGVIFGIAMAELNAKEFVMNWIAPVGTIFVKLLKLIAIPLIIASLIKGIGELKDIAKFSKIGGRTILIYIATTVIAITIGLGIVNIMKPGESIPKSTIEKMTKTYAQDEGVTQKIETAKAQKKSRPLDFIVNMVPDNVFKATTDNRSMLQVIFFVIFFGICILLIKPEDSKPVYDFFTGLNEIILKMVDIIMLTAPFAVFALLANVIVSANDPQLLLGLLKYAGTVLLGLSIMVLIYALAIKFYTKRSFASFFKGISPAQLLAFSTSSSAATLPVTMERVEEHLGVEKEVSSFVLPVGATINMDGTSLYQAVAAVFICQALDFPLTFQLQLTIVLTALLASIGSAAVPGAGMVMLVMVLQSIGLPEEYFAIGLAMIFAIDRPLDMCRTVINVTGDATVAMIVGKSVGKLSDPNVKDWDDHYGK